MGQRHEKTSNLRLNRQSIRKQADSGCRWPNCLASMVSASRPAIAGARSTPAATYRWCGSTGGCLHQISKPVCRSREFKEPENSSKNPLISRFFVYNSQINRPLVYQAYSNVSQAYHSLKAFCMDKKNGWPGAHLGEQGYSRRQQPETERARVALSVSQSQILFLRWFTMDIRYVLAAALFSLSIISAGCGGGGGGGGGGGASPTPVAPSPTIVTVGQTRNGFGPIPFSGQLNVPNRNPCDMTSTHHFGTSLDLCDIVEDSAGNFRAMGMTGGNIAVITTEVTALSSGGNTYVAKAATKEVTMAIMGQGFNLQQPSLDGVMLAQYNFLHSSAITIRMSDVESHRLNSQANSTTVQFLPSYHPLVTTGLSKADAVLLEEVFRENFRYMIHGTGASAVAAGRRTIITLVSGTYSGEIIHSAPGIAPRTRVRPINVFGALSINVCTAEVRGFCTKSRPHFIRDSNFSPRLPEAIRLAKADGAFVSSFNFTLSRASGHTLTVANTQAFKITMTLNRGNPALPKTIVTTWGVGEARIAEALPVFSPDVLPDAHPDRMPASWPQATKDAIIQGDGMVLIFPLGNNGTNDQNGLFYERALFEGISVKMTIMGTVHTGYYKGGVSRAVKFTIANDLTKPFSGQDVRAYGLDATIAIKDKQYVTRSLSQYLSYLWKFDNEALKPYLLAVAGSRNVIVGGKQTVEIDPESDGCGVAWERCITASGSHAMALSDPSDPAKDSFNYSFGTELVAAPFVAGALALLKQHFPSLRADAAADILLRTADDLGEPGPDPVYGMGHLNVVRAMSPVGELTTNRNGSGRLLTNSRLLASAPLAALALAQREITGYDSFSRPFHVHLGDLVARQPGRQMNIAQLGVIRRQRHKQADARQVVYHGSGTVEQTTFNLLPGWTFSHDFCASECLQEGDEWGFMPANLDLGGLTRLRREILADGDLVLEASLASGFANAASFRQFALRTSRHPAKGLDLSFEVGLASEKDTLLGSEFGGAFALQQGAATRFAHMSARVSLTHNTEGYGNYTQAWTRAASFPDGLVAGISGLQANSARIGLRHGNMLRKGDGLELEWSMPLAITNGRVSLLTGGYDAAGTPVTGTTSIDLQLARRQHNWGLSYVTPLAMLGLRGWLGMGIEYRTDVPGFEHSRQVYSLSANLQL